MASMLVDAAKSVPLKLATALDLAKIRAKTIETLNTEILGSKMVSACESFAESAQPVTDKYFPKELRTRKFLAVAAIDAVNVVLALRAIRDAEGEEAIFKAAGGGAAAVGFFGASVAETVAVAMKKDSSKRLKILRIVRGTQIVCSLIYAVLDFVSAAEAYAQDDKDKAAALAAAGLVELGLAIGYGVLLATGAVAGAPMIFLGVISALLYVAILFLDDDPLAEFLKNCEWGSDPYGHPDYDPLWAERNVAQWKGDIAYQMRLLLRLLSRFELKWWWKIWPRVQISSNLCRTGFKFRIEFHATFSDGSTQSKVITRTAEDLPSEPPIKFIADPETNYVELPGVRDVRCTVHYLTEFGAQEEVLEAVLLEKGHGDVRGDVKSVEG